MIMMRKGALSMLDGASPIGRSHFQTALLAKKGGEHRMKILGKGLRGYRSEENKYKKPFFKNSYILNNCESKYDSLVNMGQKCTISSSPLSFSSSIATNSSSILSSSSSSTKTTAPSSSSSSSSLVSRRKSPIVSPEEDQIMERERKMLKELHQLIVDIEHQSEDANHVQVSLQQLEDLFLVVIVGEFNAGKSSFINAMLGDHYLTSGITPTTTSLHVIRYGGSLKEEMNPENNLVYMELPLQWLKGLSLVDTPGTNAIFREHQQITEHFVPRSDLIIFLTSSERPFSESEHEFLASIRKWGKKVVVVINKCDVLQDEKEQLEVKNFVKGSIIKLLGFEPQIFSVSSKQTLNHKLLSRFPSSSSTSKSPEGDKMMSSYANPGFEWQDLEKYILETLNSVERFRIKLENPLGITQNFIKKYEKIVEDKFKLLCEDKETIEIVENQLKLFKEEMQNDFKLHQSRIENTFHELISRADIFFNDFVTIYNIRTIINKEKVEQCFTEQVIGSFIHDIEQHVSSLIDWIIDRRYKQWKAVTDYVYKRSKMSTYEEKLVGSIQNNFNFNRRELLFSIGRAVEDVVRSYDKRKDIDDVNEGISSGIKSSALISVVGGLGVGSASLMFLPTFAMASLGVTGAALTVAGSLAILPYKRNQLKRKFREHVTHSLQNKLLLTLDEKFRSELDDNIESIRNAIAPYYRFVTLEYNKHEAQKKKLQEISSLMHSIRDQIRTMFSIHEQKMKEKEKQKSYTQTGNPSFLKDKSSFANTTPPHDTSYDDKIKSHGGIFAGGKESKSSTGGQDMEKI